MENAPHDHEDSLEDDDDSGERATAARALHASVVKSKEQSSSNQEADDSKLQPESFWQKLARRENRAGEPADESLETARNAALDHESMPPEERLSPAERQLVESETAQTMLDSAESDGAEVIEPGTEAAYQAAQAAADRFLEKITRESKTAEEAAGETLRELADVIDGIPELPESELLLSAPEHVIDPRLHSEGEIPLSGGIETEDDEPVIISSGAAGAPPSRGGGGAGGAFGSSTPTPGRRPAAEASPDMVSADDAHYYERKALQRGLITGGIVGYLWGRRRGRIKAEKKFAPIKKKLEQEVKSLQTQVIEREAAIRRTAMEQVRVRGNAAAEKIVALQPIAERPVSRNRTAGFEASELHGKKPPAAERIGHVLVTAQANESSRERQPEPRAEAGTAKQVSETMTRDELLATSEKLNIDGANLRQIYETHLIGERGLRRVIAEHLRGGDVKKILRRELVEREIDFERDPILRDRARKSLAGGGAKSALNSLLQQAGATNDDDKQQAAFYQAKAEHDQQSESKQKQQRRLMDLSLGAIITLLLVIIAALILMRR